MKSMASARIPRSPFWRRAFVGVWHKFFPKLISNFNYSFYFFFWEEEGGGANGGKSNQTEFFPPFWIIEAVGRCGWGSTTAQRGWLPNPAWSQRDSRHVQDP